MTYLCCTGISYCGALDGFLVLLLHPGTHSGFWAPQKAEAAQPHPPWHPLLLAEPQARAEGCFEAAVFALACLTGCSFPSPDINKTTS